MGRLFLLSAAGGAWSWVQIGDGGLRRESARYPSENEFASDITEIFYWDCAWFLQQPDGMNVKHTPDRGVLMVHG